MAKTVFVDEAAQLLGVSRRTVYYRIRAGRLRTVRTSCGSQRVLVDSIVALLREEREVDPLRDRVAGVSGTAPFGRFRAT